MAAIPIGNRRSRRQTAPKMSQTPFCTPITPKTEALFHADSHLVTSNRLVRGGRWVFRGTIVVLDDVLADLDAGRSLDEIWERRGTLDRSDLEAVTAKVLEARADAVVGRRPVLRRSAA